MVQYFAKSLQFGSEHIYQSLPRMLALWLDYAADVLTMKTEGTSRDVNLNMCQLLNK